MPAWRQYNPRKHCQTAMSRLAAKIDTAVFNYGRSRPPGLPRAFREMVNLRPSFLKAEIEPAAVSKTATVDIRF